MKLSILMPSHYVGPRININILNASLLGSDDVEVIIRDNSGNAAKREFLSHIKEKNCRIISVDDCSSSENAQRLLNEASGQFIFFICDDDYVNARSVPQLCAEIEKIKDDPAVVGVSGLYIIDDEATGSVFRIDKFNVRRPADRLRAFLNGMPSVFQFSPVRASVLRNILAFTALMPTFLSYHDWLINTLTLAHGRIRYLDRFLYHYHNNNWTSLEISLQTDMHYFSAVGLDTSGVRLQWLAGAVEGVGALTGKCPNLPLSEAERQEMASLWITHCFSSFIYCSNRQAPDARFDAEAIKIANKWGARRTLNPPELLVDISEFYALSSPELGRRYYDFWK